MNINFQKKTIINRKTNFLIYSIEKGEMPYICFYMIKNINNYITLPMIYMKDIKESIQFMESNFNTFDYKYMGTLDYNDEIILQMVLFQPIIRILGGKCRHLKYYIRKPYYNSILINITLHFLNITRNYYMCLIKILNMKFRLSPIWV